MERFIDFPQNFWWGAATSGPQSEGYFGKPHDNVMDYWYKIRPNDFHNGVSANIASDFYHHYQEDFKLMKEIGFNSFRTSIQWSRLIDDLETGSINEEGKAFYNKVIDEAEKNGIELVMNLHHFDLPNELLEKYGGWESKHVVDLFVKFAKACFECFGDRIHYWMTFNEPMVIVEAGYLYGQHYPLYKDKGKEAMQVIFNLNLASAKVIEAYKSMHLDGKIGMIMNLTPAYPRSQSDEDRFAAHFVDDLFNNAFLDPAVKGCFPQSLVDILTKDGVLWDASDEELAIIKHNTVDYIGVNYYHPKRVQAREHALETTKWVPDRYFEDYVWKECRMNPYRGWEIFPQAIYDIAMNIRDHYNNIPWFISENGMGVEGEEKYRDENNFIQDDYRIDFYQEHLAWLSKAIHEGCNCFGYHTWTAFDCWSWNNAYKNRYGFIAIDLETQKRTIKKSGLWYKEVARNNGYYYDFEQTLKGDTQCH